MFIGHFAVALAAKKAAPRVPLGTLVLAAQFVDVIWPFFLLLGAEHVRIDPGNTPFTPLDFTHYPISHSLAAAIVWSIVVGAVYHLRRRYATGAWIVGLAVFSHWILDFVSHRPDLPLLGSQGPRVGLGLWYSVPATIVVEAGLFAIGAVFYLRATRARDRAGALGLWAWLAVLVLIYLANLAGPPPPSVAAIAAAGIVGGAILIAWAYWIDRHRDAVAAQPAP
jgi:membrane-bound metal-dependent hydrolase YbcI (DUF457 family)